MDPNDTTYLGRVAYEAYSISSRGVSLVSGTTLPLWDHQSEEIRQAWCAAANAVQSSLPAIEDADAVELKFGKDD